MALKSGKQVELHEINWALSELDFKFSGSHWRQAEKEMIVRWLNQNLFLKIHGNETTPVLNVSWKMWN